jgi:EpsI family protein
LGQVKHRRILILTLCFLFTAGVVHLGTRSYAVVKTGNLREGLAGLGGWRISGDTPLEPAIASELMLDDYINRSYANGADSVSLYIGYYLSSKKVGAAHSPLVCFPGQGWFLQDPVLKTEMVEGREIHLMHVTASTPQSKVLLIFWFQSYDRTTSSEFFQKLNTLRSRFFEQREDNAFVRVTVPMDKRSACEAYQIGISFIRDFYPVFISHVHKST